MALVQDRPPLAACGACLTQDFEAAAGAQNPSERTDLAFPAIHCAACITTIEKGFAALEGVQSARVNLTLKRAQIRHDARLSTEDLIAHAKTLGYEALPLDLIENTQDKAGRDLLMRLGVAFFASMNVMLLSVAVWSGASDATRDVFHFISGAIALPTLVFSAQPFLKSAWSALRAGRSNMDVPISMSILLAGAISLFETFNSGPHAYFDAAVMLTFFLLCGRYLDHRSRQAARSAAQELAALEVPRALLWQDGEEKSVPTSSLRQGDIIRLLPGGRAPVDGTILEGHSEVDTALLTGETLPRALSAGGQIHAGTINLTAPLRVKVDAEARDSALARVAALVTTAEAMRGRYTSLAEKAAGIYSKLVHVFAFGSMFLWLYLTGGDARASINVAAAVLIITCPCALGLAVPAVATAASGRLFRAGLLLKSPTALERLAKVDTVVFDKTGTLTLGQPRLINATAHGAEALAIAAALGAASAHPLAQALARASAPCAVTDLHEQAGYGVRGLWHGQEVRLGRAAWLGAEDLDHTATWLKIGANPALPYRFEESLRPGAEALIADLKARGLTVQLLSGDTAGAVAPLAQSLKIEDWQAGLLPAQKAAQIADLTQAGRTVLMIGDGLNDTAALAAASVSIAPASALEAARAASDFVLTGESLAPVATALTVAQDAVRRIRENFIIAVAYNLIAVPIAITGLATPLLAALAMSASSLTVTLNALRLKRSR